MKPETGDENVHVTHADFAAAAKAVGIERGDIVFFHSSLSSMGTVEGGPDTVIDGLLDAVGPEGTVAVPTLCNWQPDEQHLVFERWDPAASPSYVGKITEIFRLRPEAIRSDHATHSVAAIGARAKELTANHGASGLRPGPFSAEAFAGESPWERLVQWNAAYCFIGVTFRVCTMVHYVESLLVERALERAAPESRAKLSEEVIGWMKPGVWPGIRVPDREVIEEMLTEKGLVRRAKIGSATLRCVRAKPMVDEWVAIVESEPEKWCPEDYVAWLKKIEEGAVS
ncbi:MAG: AAC(3) family N-acetyltransferase [Planctomycetes bacterium]|nr:AAC(3) family N-acetyltransferase [Planctomycetota bacterium]